jgi:hypothetical protein
MGGAHATRGTDTRIDRHAILRLGTDRRIEDMGTVISLAAWRMAAVEEAPEAPSPQHRATAKDVVSSGESLGETIARMRSSLQLAAEALRTVATEARASADAYRLQAAEIRRQVDGVKAAVRDLKDGTAAMSGTLAQRG